MNDTDICNLALKHLGHSIEIATGALLTERSKTAKIFRGIIENTRREVLRDFDWQFATGFAELNLIEEDPTNEWEYSYRVPEDAVRVRRLFADMGRKQGAAVRPPFRIVSDLYSTAWDATVTYAQHAYASVTAGGVTTWYRSLQGTNLNHNPTGGAPWWVAITGSPPAVLYADQVDATAEYTRVITDTQLYPADFIETFSLLLAAYAAPSLTGDNEKLGQRALQLYAWRRDGATKNDANERQDDADPESPFISARN